MNVLVVIGQLPYPLDTGAKIRSYHLLTRLARKHAVTLVSFSYGPEDARKAESLKPFFREIVTIPHHGSASSPGRVFFALRNLLSSLPYSIDKYTSPDLGTTVRRLLKEQPFDLIHCDSLQMSSNVTPINGIPKILTEHNVESFIWQRAKGSEQPISRAVLELVCSWRHGSFLRDRGRHEEAAPFLVPDFRVSFPMVPLCICSHRRNTGSAACSRSAATRDPIPSPSARSRRPRV